MRGNLLKYWFFVVVALAANCSAYTQYRVASVNLKPKEINKSFVTCFSQGNKTYYSIFTYKKDTVIRVVIDERDSVVIYNQDLSDISKLIFAIQKDVGESTTSIFGVKPFLYGNSIFELVSNKNTCYFVESNLQKNEITVRDSFNLVKNEIAFLSYIKNNTFYLFSYIDKSNTIKLRKFNPEVGLVSMVGEIKHPSMYLPQRDNTNTYLLSDVLNTYFEVMNNTLQNKPLNDFAKTEKIYIQDSAITIFFNEQLNLSSFITISTKNLNYIVDSIVTIPDKKINDDRAKYVSINSFLTDSILTKAFFYNNPYEIGVVIKQYNIKDKSLIGSCILNKETIDNNQLKIIEQDWTEKQTIQNQRRPSNFLNQILEKGIFLKTYRDMDSLIVSVGAMRVKITFEDVIKAAILIVYNAILPQYILYVSSIEILPWITIYMASDLKILESTTNFNLKDNQLYAANNPISSYNKVLNFLRRINKKNKTLFGLNGDWYLEKPLLGYYNTKNNEYEIYRLQ